MQLEMFDRYKPANPAPSVTCLSFSAGAQSTAILELLLRGEIARPQNFLVVSADPGMEDARTYQIRDEYIKRCEDIGVHCAVVQSGDLRADVIRGCQSQTRIDTPPFWVKKSDGSVGQLQQQCTQFYKIAPIKKAVREFAKARRLSLRGCGVVEQWIGFAWDERSRVKPPDAKYIQFRYPLFDMKLTKKMVSDLYLKWGIQEPPRSVCNGCFANGLLKLKWLHDNDKEAWHKVVEFDDALRGPRGVPGIKGECFVSKTCLPLRTLAELRFQLPAGYQSTQVDFSCDSGFCFT